MQQDGVFVLCRWSDMWDDDDIPPDRFIVKAKTMGQLRDLLAALGVTKGGER